MIYIKNSTDYSKNLFHYAERFAAGNSNSFLAGRLSQARFTVVVSQQGILVRGDTTRMFPMEIGHIFIPQSGGLVDAFIADPVEHFTEVLPLFSVVAIGDTGDLLVLVYSPMAFAPPTGLPNLRPIGEWERLRDVLLPVKWEATVVGNHHVFPTSDTVELWVGREEHVEIISPALIEHMGHIAVFESKVAPIIVRLHAGEFLTKWIHHSQRVEHQFLIHKP